MTDGEGMVIFGTSLVLAARNLKCSSMGWSAGKSSLPVTFRLSGLVCTPWNWMPWSSTTRSQPVEVPEEIEVPPRAAELAVGGELQADLLLLLDDLPDLLVLDRSSAGRA